LNSCRMKCISLITAWFLEDTCCTDKSVIMFLGSTMPCHGKNLPFDVPNHFQICKNAVRAADVVSHTVTRTYPLPCTTFLCCCSKRDNPSYIAYRYGLFRHSFRILDLCPVGSPVSERTSQPLCSDKSNKVQAVKCSHI
jgi:hypothetical protein